MALWDKGEYCKVVLDGDIHTTNQEAAGLATRDNAKTFFYAFIYGAGNEKIGKIVGKDAKEGGRLKRKFLNSLPALKSLIEAVKSKAQKKGYILGLDKRRIPIRHAHAALNTLLQSAGALLAKQSMVIMRDKIIAKGWQGRAHQVLWCHDEHQWDCEPEIADEVGRMQVESYLEAGRHFNFRIPIDGEYKVGNNWAETH
jgi:DNA polymerase I-like protein with 3'-5' exonuclease and polymerase domains